MNVSAVGAGRNIERIVPARIGAAEPGQCRCACRPSGGWGTEVHTGALQGRAGGGVRDRTAEVCRSGLDLDGDAGERRTARRVDVHGLRRAELGIALRIDTEYDAGVREIHREGTVGACPARLVDLAANVKATVRHKDAAHRRRAIQHVTGDGYRRRIVEAAGHAQTGGAERGRLPVRVCHDNWLNTGVARRSRSRN